MSNYLLRQLCQVAKLVHMISLVVAMSTNKVIGADNDLPWHLPADLKHFRHITEHHTVVMGRKTWQSIFNRLNKPLPNRTNVVITRDKGFAAENVVILHNVEQILQLKGEVFIIGGAEIYKQSLHLVERLYITQVDVFLGGDAFFPEFSLESWQETSREIHKADKDNQYAYSFLTFDRKHATSTN